MNEPSLHSLYPASQGQEQKARAQPRWYETLGTLILTLAMDAFVIAICFMFCQAQYEHVNTPLGEPTISPVVALSYGSAFFGVILLVVGAITTLIVTRQVPPELKRSLASRISWIAISPGTITFVGVAVTVAYFLILGKQA